MTDSLAQNFSAQRRVNTVDRQGRVEILDLSGADLTTEALADWSGHHPVLAYDEVTLEVAFTRGNATGFRIGVQAGPRPNAAAAEWFDLYDDSGGGVLTRRVYALDPAADAQVAVTFRVAYPYMRVKLWGVGADLTGSRALVWAVRHMLA